MARTTDLVEIDGATLKHETAKAILVTIDGEDHWFPKSHVDAATGFTEIGETGTLVCSRWIAREKGFEVD